MTIKYYCPECKEYQGTWKDFGHYIDAGIQEKQVCVRCYEKWLHNKIWGNFAIEVKELIRNDYIRL